MIVDEMMNHITRPITHTRNIPYSLVGQDTWLSTSIPGFNSRHGNFFGFEIGDWRLENGGWNGNWKLQIGN